jgi:diacylglycerol kinase (ATP)
MAPGILKPFTPRNELHRLIFATRNSLRGYRLVFRDEAAFRAQILVFIILIPLSIWLANGFLELMLLLGVWVLVLAGELVNSAIEALVDRIGPEYHELSGKAKDAGSALTLTLMTLAGLIWLAFLLDRFFPDIWP